MELCTGGSLYHMLDEPENCYGVSEQEFKNVLHDVCKYIGKEGKGREEVRNSETCLFIWEGE